MASSEQSLGTSNPPKGRASKDLIPNGYGVRLDLGWMLQSNPVEAARFRALERTWRLKIPSGVLP
jgi:hypothetical protein